ncbi:type VI secretion system baseplate subunit TssK [Enhygromyxa salina]|uniref:Uncharacterized protein n=1 Tax=Enhygromyxa salina TaxID=215803 RepID=A0A2S9YUF8_9BACT|nr:type VI secretion system baseplate subunit TssK [Enhygromyxa salina]PRQ08672.1 hypothetical protein ENSA7_16170 [Enhygromyxa salina]
MSGKLAFPAWAMGQVLLPEQFQAQQEALLAHVGVRAALSGLPAYGLARLVINEELLATGALSVERLTYVFASGLLIDTPGNAVLTNANLGELTDDTASIYLHIHNDVIDATDLAHYVDDPRSVTRVIFRAELSLAARLDDARESVKLMELVRDRDRRWVLGAYSPPLLRTGGGGSPFLRDKLSRCQRSVRAVEAQLGRRIKDAFLGREQVSELRRIRAAAYRVLAVLADHGFGEDAQVKVALHPYMLFSLLRDFDLEAAILSEDQSVTHPRYHHEDLAASFEVLRQRIDGQLGASSLNSKRLEFTHRASWYVAAPFPDDLCTSNEVFLIVKSSGPEPVMFDDIKLASPRRIEEIYSHALAGVPLTPMNATTAASFAQTYGRDAAFYEVGTAGDLEWAHAVSERELCFPSWRELEGISAVLVWGG